MRCWGGEGVKACEAESWEDHSFDIVAGEEPEDGEMVVYGLGLDLVFDGLCISLGKREPETWRRRRLGHGYASMGLRS